MADLMFFDSTLRDGSHTLKHQLSLESIAKYCKAVDNAGLHTVIVGHGNGLGASSLQVGLALHDDESVLRTARENLTNTRLGVYMIPGFGTIKDNLMPAIDIGVDLFKVGTHCTEADTTREHIDFLSNKGHEVYGVLMMTHMATPKQLAEEAQKMESYGARGVVLMDSAGALLPNDVVERIQAILEKTELEVGFHAHNNLSMATANTVAAINAGATIVDATTRGIGGGEGNCQLEVLLAVLQKMGMETGVDLYTMLDASDNIVVPEFNFGNGISTLSIVSGLSGVFSAFNEKVQRAANEFDIDPRDIFIELGKQKVVAGQEDLIVDVAMRIVEMQNKDNSSYLLESLL